ncbi:unnamed protein product, partial [Coregonus sp. 'balchen']
VGQVNPTVKLYVVSLDGGSQTTELRPPNSFEKSDYYITMVKWVTEEKICVRWLNRAQNTSVLSLCEVTMGACVKKHVITSEKWLDRQNEEPVFSKDGNTFFLTMPIKHGGRGSFHHIAMISDQFNGVEVNMRHLTSGSWEVSQILEVSVVDPFQRECLTCSLFKPQCSYYDAVFSPDYQYVLLNCRGPGIPRTTLYKLNDMSSKYKSTNNSNNDDHGINETLEKNTALRDALLYRNIPRRDIRTLQINNFALRLELTLPIDFDEATAHPLLLILDSAPCGQAVSEQFVLDWDSVLVSSDNVIVARLDGSGSGFLGQRVLHEVHQRLGTVEVQDQIAAVDYLTKLPYVDNNKVAVYGKAYGGFLSSLLLLSSGSMFRCGVAVAPVTDWRLYGSAFTERYFGFPVQDDRKYQLSSLLPNITGTGHQKFLIIHGTADATVHFQHSAELVKLLSISNVNYSLQIFPDEGHNIDSVKSQRYLLNSVMNFFKECFLVEIPVAHPVSEDD